MGQISCYPGTHNPEELAFDECSDIHFNDQEKLGSKILTFKYIQDEECSYPSRRYRPTITRVILSISQSTLVSIIIKIVSQTSKPELV